MSRSIHKMFIHDPQESIQMLAATEYSVLVGLPYTGGSFPPYIIQCWSDERKSNNQPV